MSRIGSEYPDARFSDRVRFREEPDEEEDKDGGGDEDRDDDDENHEGYSE